MDGISEMKGICVLKNEINVAEIEVSSIVGNNVCCCSVVREHHFLYHNKIQASLKMTIIMILYCITLIVRSSRKISSINSNPLTHSHCIYLRSILLFLLLSFIVLRECFILRIFLFNISVVTL